MARKKLEAKGDVRRRLNGLANVVEQLQGWAPAGQVLTRVRARRTCFVQVDRATRVCGWPLQRIALVHGPSNHGKTVFAHGLGLSFLRAGDVYGFIDAEYTTPEDWLVKLMQEHASAPGFIALRPHSYEETVQAVRELVTKLASARAEGTVDPETSALIVVDSIRKLVPEGLLAKMLKCKDGIDGAKGRAAMMKAALNSQWLDELTPLMHHTGSTMVIIARESENVDSSGPYDVEYKVGGGRSLLFDSSLACRVTRAAWVKRGSDDSEQIIGERHRVRIYKTKVGGKEGKYEDAYFYTSNGQFIAEGFDHARGLLEQATAYGLVCKAKAKRSESSKGGGAWIDWRSTGERFNGEHAFVKALSDDARLFAMLDAEVRARIEQEVSA